MHFSWICEPIGFLFNRYFYRLLTPNTALINTILRPEEIHSLVEWMPTLYDLGIYFNGGWRILLQNKKALATNIGDRCNILLRRRFGKAYIWQQKSPFRPLSPLRTCSLCRKKICGQAFGNKRYGFSSKCLLSSSSNIYSS